jgi:hypothetical protein
MSTTGEKIDDSAMIARLYGTLGKALSRLRAEPRGPDLIGGGRLGIVVADQGP